jgi:hypothetical protein
MRSKFGAEMESGPKVAVNSLGEPLFRQVFAASYLPHARDWATAAPRGWRRAPANALIVSRSVESGGAAGGLASYAAAAGAQSRLPVNRISDLQKFRAAILRKRRRSRAKSASPIGAKLWEMLDDYTGALAPQSLRSDYFLAARNCAVPRQQKWIVLMLS